MAVEAIDLCSLRPVWMNLTFMQDHMWIRNQQLLETYPHPKKFSVSLAENWYAATQPLALCQLCTKLVSVALLVWFFKRHLSHWPASRHLWISLFQTLHDITHNKGLQYNSVWTTLTFTQDHRVIERLELVKSFCRKVVWTNADVGSYVRGMTTKRSLSMANMNCLSIYSSCFIWSVYDFLH